MYLTDRKLINFTTSVPRGIKMVNVIEFFRNLPKKKCTNCGHEMIEQADCYNNLCDECNDPAR